MIGLGTIGLAMKFEPMLKRMSKTLKDKAGRDAVTALVKKVGADGKVTAAEWAEIGTVTGIVEE